MMRRGGPMSRRLDKPGPLKRQRLATSRPVRRGRAWSRRGLWLILAPACLAAALVGGAALVMQPAARRAEVKPAPSGGAVPGNAAQKPGKVAEAVPPPKPESAPVPPPAAAPPVPAPAGPASAALAPATSALTVAAAPPPSAP